MNMKRSQGYAQTKNEVDLLSGSRMGDRLLEAGKLSSADIDRVVEAQRETSLRFGEVAIKLGLITGVDVQRALAQQYDYPFLDIGNTSISPAVVTAHDPFGKQAEAIRHLRSQLMLRWFGDRRIALAITTARSGGGTSWIAANLAVAFAQLGERTALIDANMRRPGQQELFGLAPICGLSEVLSGRASIKEAYVVVPEFEKLSVMCAGSVPLNPQELLSRVAFSYLIESAPSTFDVLLIDTPPIDEAADAQIAAARAGGYLLSARLDDTRVAEVNRVKTTLEPAGSVFVGAVLQH